MTTHGRWFNPGKTKNKTIWNYAKKRGFRVWSVVMKYSRDDLSETNYLVYAGKQLPPRCENVAMFCIEELEENQPRCENEPMFCIKELEETNEKENKEEANQSM